MYFLSTVCCALTSTMDNFLALRVLQGIGAGAGPVLSRAIVRDLYGPTHSARVLSLIQAIVVMGPIIAPIIGGYLLVWFGWRSIFWLLVIYGVLCLTTMILCINETNSHRSTLGIAHAFRGYAHVLRDKRYVGYVLTSGFAFGGLFAFVTGSPFVIIELFGVAPQHFGFLFGISAIALSVGAALNSQLVTRLGFHRMLVIGSSITAFAGVLIYTVARFELGGLFGLFIPICCALAAVTLIAPNAAVGAMENHPARAGAASALLSALQFGFGALGGWLVGWLHDGSAMPLAHCDVNRRHVVVCRAALAAPVIEACSSGAPMGTLHVLAAICTPSRRGRRSYAKRTHAYKSTQSLSAIYFFHHLRRITRAVHCIARQSVGDFP